MRRLVVLLALLCPAAAAAQTPRFEITPTVGYRLNGEVEADERFLDVDPNLEVEESALFGVILDVPINPNVQVELLVNRQESQFVLDEGFLDPSVELGDVTLSTAHVGFLFQWGLGQVNPYVVLSGGLTRLEPDFPEIEAETRLSGSLGGGVKLFFNRNVGLRIEGRGYWVDLDADFEDDRFDSDVDEGLFLGEGSAGLIVAW